MYTTLPLAKDSPLVPIFSKAINKLIETGTIHRIVEKYSQRDDRESCDRARAGEKRSLGYENVFLPFMLMGGIAALR